MTNDKLIEHIEAAAGPDRKLDVAIYKTIPDLLLEVPAYTASIDAAMTLVPEPPVSAMGEFVSVGLWDTNGVYPAHIRATAWVAGAPRTYAATPALALCAAALRASHREQEEGR